MFIHVPKCAGQSVERFFLNRAGLDWETRAPFLLRFNDQEKLGPPRLAHLKAHQYVEKKWMTPSQFEEYFKFAFVRNPWDRIASFYRYLGYDRRCSFSRFVHTHLPRKMQSKAWFLGPQAHYLYGSDGKLLIDFIGQFETLPQDFAMVCERMGIADAKLPHVNRSSEAGAGFKNWLRRKPKPYRDLYDSRSKDAVRKIYEVDVDTFKYPF